MSFSSSIKAAFLVATALHFSSCKSDQASSRSQSDPSQVEQKQEVAPKKSNKLHRAVVFFDPDGKLKLDYEGTGVRQRSGRSGETQGEVHFSAIHLENVSGSQIHNPKLADASLKGSWSLSGPDDRKVEFDLKVKNRVPFEILFMGMSKDGKTHEFRKKFAPGKNSLKFNGIITQYFQKS